MTSRNDRAWSDSTCKWTVRLVSYTCICCRSVLSCSLWIASSTKLLTSIAPWTAFTCCLIFRFAIKDIGKNCSYQLLAGVTFSAKFGWSSYDSIVFNVKQSVEVLLDMLNLHNIFPKAWKNPNQSTERLSTPFSAPEGTHKRQIEALGEPSL